MARTECLNCRNADAICMMAEKPLCGECVRTEVRRDWLLHDIEYTPADAFAKRYAEDLQK